jgi:glycosyltransferase involved in cell wall biosynthesis
MNVHYLLDYYGWNSEKHLAGIRRYTPDNWHTRSSLWVFGNTKWDFDHDDVIVNLGCNCQEQLWMEAHRRAYRGLIITRHYSCYPRSMDFWQRSLRCSHAVMVESRLCYERTKRLGKVYMGLTGVDLEVFRPTVPLWQRPRKALWCAGLIGQDREHHEVKGLATARDVAEILRQQYRIELDMLIVDPHGAAERTRKTTEEMVEWYNTGRVHLITSMSEGVPNVGLEAAACGCVVVSTPVGRMVELLDGLHDQLVTLPTPERLAKAVSLACDRAESREVADDVAKQIEPFGWSHIVPHWYHLFEKLLCYRSIMCAG